MKQEEILLKDILGIIKNDVKSKNGFLTLKKRELAERVLDNYVPNQLIESKAMKKMPEKRHMKKKEIKEDMLEMHKNKKISSLVSSSDSDDDVYDE